MMTRFFFVETCECEKCLRWFIKHNYMDQKVWERETKVGNGNKNGEGLVLTLRCQTKNLMFMNFSWRLDLLAKSLYLKRLWGLKKS
jgi:hypothetical protein